VLAELEESLADLAVSQVDVQSYDEAGETVNIATDYKGQQRDKQKRKATNGCYEC